MSDSFVHLHVHTEYSMLDGAARLKQMFKQVGDLGMPAIAITDHGNMHGAYDFYRQATGAGIKPIIGIEAYVSPASRLQKKPVLWGEPHQRRDDVSAGGYYTHMTIWAKNAKGLSNLMKLSSRAYTEGFVRKWARMDAETLAEHSEGLMATTGCPSGEVQTRLRLGQYDEALAAAARYQELFGRDDYYLEIMDHGLDIERRVREGLTRICRELDIPPLVTNDSHYTYESDATSHDALLCIQTGKQLSDPDRFRFDGSGYYIKTADEMRGVDSSDLWAEGCRNTLLVAAIGPELGRPARRLALRTLPPFRPLFNAVAWVERRVRPVAETTEATLAVQARLHAERDMLGGVFALRETTVAEVMTPRIDIVAVDIAMSRDQAVATLRSSEHARLLVYEGHPDNIAGVLYAKDMLALLGAGSADDNDRTWTSVIRPAAFVPEGKTLDRQLRDFQRGPGHLAVVVDEFGGTAGIVTLEDILEQIVGEIQDEYDTDEVAPVQRLDEGHWRVQGGVGLTELEGVLNHRFTRDDVSTVGGLVLAELGRVPKPGERLSLDEYEVTVDQVAQRRVRRVTIRRREAAAADAGSKA